VNFKKLSEFTFDPSRDVVLFFRRRNPWLWSLLVGGILVAVLSFTLRVTDPNWIPDGIRGRGMWIVALLALMPVAMRGLLLTLLIGVTAEMMFRGTWRIFDRNPDFVIGSHGIADLNPWCPEVIAWKELHRVTRTISRGWLFKQAKPLSLNFVARRSPPNWLSSDLWRVLPEFITERQISIYPDSLGLAEDQVLSIAERFTGKLIVQDIRLDP
jgi:hypothetical protein